jgi:hypothetical protein
MRETKYQTGMIDPLNKAMGRLDAPLTPSEAGQPGWRLLAEELSLPAAVLYEDRLTHNLQWMRNFMGAYGVQLAPHGKTTMAPKLFARQLAEGAWGITLATAHQTAAAAAHGVKRVLMANQLVGRRNMEIVADLLAPTRHSSSSRWSIRPRWSTSLARSSTRVVRRCRCCWSWVWRAAAPVCAMPRSRRTCSMRCRAGRTP